jgi:two-component system, OmpR family, sensor histidine kinase VanS
VREQTVDRAPGLSVRLKLTLSYAGFLVLAGAVLLALWVLLLQYFPGSPLIRSSSGIGGALLPGRSPTQQAFGEAAAIALAFLLVFGLLVRQHPIGL